jgi:hypothetical protein
VPGEFLNRVVDIDGVRYYDVTPKFIMHALQQLRNLINGDDIDVLSG